MTREQIAVHRDKDSWVDAGLHIAFVVLLIGVALFFALGGAAPLVSGATKPSPTYVEIAPLEEPQDSTGINASRRIYVRSA